MKLHILDAKKGKKGETDLPAQFHEPIRPDLIKRAVLSLQAAGRQPYGTDPKAGKHASATVSKRRRDYRGSYGHGISRTPRKVMSRSGIRMNWVGAFAPNTVGGRRAHPPKATKVWTQKINRKENRKAIRSALSATVDKETVALRGHKVPAEYPFILDSSFESMSKTQQIEQALIALGFADELDRAVPTRARSGRAKMRGRKTKRALSLLLVCSDADAKLMSGAANIPGVTVAPVNALNAELLAPGTHPGRATLFTEQALAELTSRKLFLDGAEPVETKAAPVRKSAPKESAPKAEPEKKAPRAAAKKKVE